MGNRLTVNSGSQTLRPTGKSSLVQNSENSQQKHRGSNESLSTFFSLDSHADQCLLPKEHHTTALVDSTPAERIDLQQFSTRGHDTTSIDDGDASTIITTLDDLISNGGDPSVMGTENTEENLKIPERLVQKLTTEDWNDLIQFICSTMEQSLQSNILQAIQKLRENNQHQEALPTNSELNSTIDNNRETSLDAADTTNHTTTATKRAKHRHHNRHPRPLSMPSVSSTQLVDTEAKHHQKHSNGHHGYIRNKHHSTTRDEDEGSPPSTKLNDESDNNGKAIPPTNGGSSSNNNGGLVRNKVRSSSNPNTHHKVHFTDGTPGSRLSSNVWRSCSGSSLDDLELNNKHCKYMDGGRRRGYLTLDQLKDLGLTLQQDSSKSTSERLSSFSMKCWHGDPHNNQVTSTTALVSSRRHPPKRRHRKRSSSKSKHESLNTTKSSQFEQLCLLGPETSSTPLPPSSSSPSVTPVPDNDTTPSPHDNEDTPSGDNSTASSSEDSITAADVKVEHLHQHSHHHFHHFIHHSISQPSGLCDNYNTDKPSVQYIVNTDDRTVNSR